MSYPTRAEGLGKYDKDERTRFFRKIYLSLYLKGFERVTKGIVMWEVSFFPVLLGCSTGGTDSAGHGSYSSIFSPTDLNFLSPELYNNLTPTYFLRASQFALNVTPDLLISSTGCTCYLHRCISFFDSLAGSEVNMQQNHLTVCR